MLRWATNHKPHHPSRRTQSVTLTWWRKRGKCPKSDTPAPPLPNSRRMNLMPVDEHQGCRLLMRTIDEHLGVDQVGICVAKVRATLSSPTHALTILVYDARAVR